MYKHFTCDGNNVEQPPHGLWTDVAEPVLCHQQLGEIEGHLSGDGPLHLPTPVRVLSINKTEELKLRFYLLFQCTLNNPIMALS